MSGDEGGRNKICPLIVLAKVANYGGMAHDELAMLCQDRCAWYVADDEAHECIVVRASRSLRGVEGGLGEIVEAIRNAVVNLRGS